APAKSSGCGLLALFLGGTAGAIVLVACVAVCWVLFGPPGKWKPLAQGPAVGTDRQPGAGGPTRRVKEVGTVPVHTDKGAPEDKPKDKPDPGKPPVEGPPPPKNENAGKTRDGAMTLTAHPDKHLRFAAISPDGKVLYTAAWDNQLRIWDADKFELKDELPLPK